ncbi:toxin-antitoxin system YwqK family antitoxin [Defluviitalea phaphyphila]|uniref:toxin-antitoxin system YwqK family antitoxin n=1 Tax=Defluviitalea phaphyphila TaxID=1473580 RepID=UPI00072FB5BE|nr:hypothetical protein [Defluviitalea phaphyphila]
MKNIRVLSQNEVLEKGIEFDGDYVCYSGEYGEQVYKLPMEEGGHPVNGLLYEKYDNGNIKYYSYYKDGIPNGEYVEFYDTGEIRRYCIMDGGQVLGEDIIWYKNGNIKLRRYWKYGIEISYEKFDEKGNIISRKIEPNDTEKELLETFKKLYEE